MTDPQTRKLARQLVQMDERIKHLETVPQMAHSSIDDHGLPVYDKDGNLVTRIGKQADGTWGAPPLGGPIPSPPVGVSATGGPGLVNITWTGDYAHGAAPLDFDALEVLIDGALAGSISNRDGGTVGVVAEHGTRYVSARVRTLVPRHSPLTSPFAVAVGPPADQLFIDAQERIEAAEEELEAAKLELQEAAANVVQTREDLTRLEEETLPAVVAELEEADRLANERLTAALQRIDEASGVVIDAAERLEETDRRLTALNTRVDEVGERPRVYRGAAPGMDAPMGSYWITDTDHLYVRVPCEEVPDGA